MTDTVTVALGERRYDILIGKGLLARADRLITPVMRSRRAVIVTDETVARAHAGDLVAALDAAGIAAAVETVPAGESSKSMTVLADLVERLLARGIDRSTTIVALGGGVVGDLAGFAAAVLLRGVDFVQVPTSLLAQVDSSVGGKTGVNAAAGKNLIGAFHQPRLVLADTGTLDTLPDREMKAGYAEIVKYGAIDRPDFFDWLESNGRSVLAREQAALAHAVAESCRSKAAIVAADEREHGGRALLNLGHTFAHALEAEAGYDGSLLHGEAVAIGMVMAFEFSVELGHCSAPDARRLRDHLADAGLPTTIGERFAAPPPAKRLFHHMTHDKKASGGRVTLILTRGIGGAFTTAETPETRILSFLSHAITEV
ncbi:3-dehydroquinate synthase [Fodinicurvata sp. EGI_FJ10296]|uniref:3-dehydroquinate synthase n=1 Tax=Fodinicurvata sp. EGI_FJ10296 TaxID=3231908 RepID=UPI003455C507